MKPTNRLIRNLIAGMTLALGLGTLCASNTATNYVQSELRQGDTWGARNWTAEDLNQFGGEPQVAGDTSTTLLVRYSYFVSDYDTAKLSPRWVAHLDTKASAKAGEKRKGDKWDRGQYVFRPDANIVTYSQDHNIAWVTNADYTNANPAQLKPVTAKNRITRGHMASNLEMKGHGDDNSGMQSQQESFSFANVCPQMQGHNAPLWSSLESDCLELASKLDRVAVFTGPVYTTTDDEPVPTTNAPKGKCHIPIPTHFYKIIIATVNGHIEALGFLIPHQSDLKADQRFDYVVSVRKIEKAAGINFMPTLGANDDVENHPSDELLDLLQKN